ncbi:MAG TPA: WG repeat-containing protein [Bacillota bacterium]|nr:WG repeat-containing protein [Bacillota bacterium]
MGFFNQKGEVVIEPQFEYASRFENNFAAVGSGVTKELRGELEFVKAERWGFINKKGELVIPYRYQEIVSLFDRKGRAIVVKDGEKITINPQGKER